MGAPLMTADDFGMSRWWDEPGAAGAPQTARSDGDGPFPISLFDHADLDSLDAARLHYARRMAADAVDHLIALMDAIDARTEDLEPQNEDGDVLDYGEGDTLEDAEDDDPAEPSLGWTTRDNGAIDTGIYAGDCEYDTADHEPSLGALEGQLDQTVWARGGDDDREADDADLEDGDEDGDLHDPSMAVVRPPAFLWGTVYVD